MRFAERLGASIERNNSLLCVGLDPDPSHLPEHLRDHPDAVFEFTSAIVEATIDIAAAYKPNLGFYIGYGEAGIRALAQLRQAIPREIPVILDCKVGDIGITSDAYARGYFDVWDFDAITANPYLGKDSLEPFLRYSDRAVFVLAKTSNPGSGDLQDLAVLEDGSTSEPLYMRVADRVGQWDREYGTGGIVVGATYPEQLAAVRERCPDVPMLVPGVGAQEGQLAATIQAGLGKTWPALTINASRAIIYASGGHDFADAAREVALELRNQINSLR